MERLDRRLILEPAGHDVDPVAEASQRLGELQDIDDLAAGVGPAELGLAAHIAVGRDHQDSPRWATCHLVSLRMSGRGDALSSTPKEAPTRRISSRSSNSPARTAAGGSRARSCPPPAWHRSWL